MPGEMRAALNKGFTRRKLRGEAPAKNLEFLEKIRNQCFSVSTIVDPLKGGRGKYLQCLPP